LILLAIIDVSACRFKGRGLAGFGPFLPQKIKTVSNAVSEKSVEFWGKKPKMVTPPGIEPGSQV
jgi:hypothetical protein